MRMANRAKIGFSALMVLVFAFAVFEARTWQIEARLFPWVIGFPLLALALIQLALDIWKPRGNTSEDASVEVPAWIVGRRTVPIIAWIMGFVLAIWLLGLSISVPVFTFLYLKLQAQERWWLAVLFALVAWGVLFGLFDRALHLPFPEGRLLRWLGV